MTERTVIWIVLGVLTSCSWALFSADSGGAADGGPDG